MTPPISKEKLPICEVPRLEMEEGPSNFCEQEISKILVGPMTAFVGVGVGKAVKNGAIMRGALKSLSHNLINQSSRNLSVNGFNVGEGAAGGLTEPTHLGSLNFLNLSGDTGDQATDFIDFINRTMVPSLVALFERHAVETDRPDF